MSTHPQDPHTFGAPEGQPVMPAQQQPAGQTFAPAQQPVGQPVVPQQQQPVMPAQQQPVMPAQQPVMQAPLPQQQAMPPQQFMQQPPLQAGPVKQKVHHSYIWLGGISTAFSVAVALFFVSIASIFGEGINLARGNSSGLILLGVLALIVVFVLVCGITIGIRFLAYKNLYYEIDTEEFSLYSGIITKKRVHIPYQRIQSVNQRASLLQRLFGVCTVNIDTAGGSSNKAVLIPYVRNTEAERLRVELFTRKQQILAGQGAQNTQAAAYSGMAAPQAYAGAPAPAPQGAPVLTAAPGAYGAPAPSQASNVLDMPANYVSDVRGVFGGEAVDTGRVTYEYGLTNKELALSGLSNSTSFALIVAAIVGGVITIAGYVMQTAIGQVVVQEGIDLAMGAITGNFLVPVILGVLALLALVWGISIIGTCVSYGGFKASRRGSRIEVQYGLLQHQFHGVDVDRVQSVIIKQGFLRRFLKYCELSLGKIDAIVGDSSQGQNNMPSKGLVVHPFVKMDKVPEILSGLVPEFANVPTEEIKLPKASLKRAIIRRSVLHGSGLWLAVMAAIIQIILNFVVPLYPGIDMHSLAAEISIVNIVCMVVYALCAIILVVEVIGTFLWFKNSSFAYNHDFMQINNGGYSFESISFPRKKIQFGTVKSNPLQRRKRVATISARTAAGVAGTTMRLLDVSERDASAWLEWLIPGGNKHMDTKSQGMQQNVQQNIQPGMNSGVQQNVQQNVQPGEGTPA